MLVASAFLARNDYCLSQSKGIEFNEIMINGEGGKEFIELYNPSDDDISLDGYYINYYSSGREWENPYRSKPFPKGEALKSKNYYLISIKSGEYASDEDWCLGYSSHQLSDSSGALAIFGSHDFREPAAIDVVSWGKVDYVGKGEELDVVPDGFSFEKDDGWRKSYVIGGTPAHKNSVKPEDPPPLPPRTYDSKIILNELLPNPLKGEEEFIELHNFSRNDVDLSGYLLRDGSKNGKYVFPEGSRISAGGYLVKYEKDFKFALNDSGQESVYLFDPSEKLVDSMEYSGSKENYSYSFDGAKWRRTPFLTPGAKNFFQDLLDGVVKKDDKIFEKMYANFEAVTGGKAEKFTWDFGDGRKSYKRKTRHKYEKQGKYLASLKISGDGEDNIINFEVDVLEFSHSKVRIVAINANPEGKDSDAETLTVKNKSKKKINLKGWSVKTGKKKQINHPIKNDILIKPGKEEEITRKDCSFTLPNEKGKIELHYPDGKEAHKVAYEHNDGPIEEGEIYRKIKGGWEWVKTKAIKNDERAYPEDRPEEPEIKKEKDELADMTEEEISQAIGKMTEIRQVPMIVLKDYDYVRPKILILGEKGEPAHGFRPRDPMNAGDIFKAINHMMNRSIQNIKAIDF